MPFTTGMSYAALGRSVLRHLPPALYAQLSPRLSAANAQQEAYNTVLAFSRKMSRCLWQERKPAEHTRLSIVQSVAGRDLISIYVPNSRGDILDYLAVELRSLNDRLQPTPYLLLFCGIDLKKSKSFREFFLTEHTAQRYSTGIPAEDNDHISDLKDAYCREHGAGGSAEKETAQPAQPSDETDYFTGLNRTPVQPAPAAPTLGSSGEAVNRSVEDDYFANLGFDARQTGPAAPTLDSVEANRFEAERAELERQRRELQRQHRRAGMENIPWGLLFRVVLVFLAIFAVILFIRSLPLVLNALLEAAMSLFLNLGMPILVFWILWQIIRSMFR